MSKEKGLDKIHKVLLGIMYFIIIVCFFLVIILFGTVSERITYPIVSILLLMFMIVFPCGFSFYGASMIYILAQAKLYKFTRITVLVILINIKVFLDYAIGAPIVAGYIFGWDVAGMFYATFRNVMLDLLVLSDATLVYLVLFQIEKFKDFYCCREEDE